jgi:hypothetical protein
VGHEIDDLIDELEMLRGTLQSDGHRIQRDIAKYAALSEEISELTKIVSDSMQRLPGAQNISTWAEVAVGACTATNMRLFEIV